MTITAIPTTLLERVASLSIDLVQSDSLHAVLTHVTERCPELETLTLSRGDVPGVFDWSLSSLGELPRLRELTIVSATVEQLAGWSARLPSVRVFGQVLVSGDPRTWPIAQQT